MAYTLMIKAIQAGKQSKATLTKKANVYFMVDELNEEEYREIKALIDAMPD